MSKLYSEKARSAQIVTFVDLFSAPFALLAALISAVAIQQEQKTFTYLEQFEDFVKQSKIYYRDQLVAGIMFFRVRV